MGRQYHLAAFAEFINKPGKIIIFISKTLQLFITLLCNNRTTISIRCFRWIC